MQKKIAVILFGAPGSGKGTQANLLAAKYGLIHIDTGRILEMIVHDPKRQNDPIIKREKALWEGGKWNTPTFVTGEILKRIRAIHKAGYGLVFSGSPRTTYEAERFIPLLEKLYKRKNVHVFALDVDAKYSLKRNTSRMVCSVCGYGLLRAFFPVQNPKHCPVCGGPFYRRKVDKPSVIKQRLQEHAKRTRPVLKFFHKYGLTVHHLDGTPAPYLVFEKLEKLVEK